MKDRRQKKRNEERAGRRTEDAGQRMEDKGWRTKATKDRGRRTEGG